MKCNNVLIIEDDRDIRESLQLVLETEGYSVKAAANGHEGMEMLKRINRPCLILLDLMMPVMNGWEFLQARSQDIMVASIPVVVVSAATDRLKEAKADGALRKPVEIDALIKIVEGYCGKPATP